MPLYDYHCRDCGDFRSWQSMNESDANVACPDCDLSATRSVTAPSLALMPSNNRIANSRNEKSADQPEVITKKAPQDGGGGVGGHAHGGHQHSGHNHSHGHSHGRPWMIGH